MEQTDLKLVESILDAGQNQELCKDGWQPASSRSTFLARNLLLTLLKSPAQEVSGTECNNSVSSWGLTVSRHAWLVTKLLLSQCVSSDGDWPFHLDFTFCANPQPCSDGSHEYQWEWADFFLRTHIPVKWRNELKEVEVRDELVNDWEREYDWERGYDWECEYDWEREDNLDLEDDSDLEWCTGDLTLRQDAVPLAA